MVLALIIMIAGIGAGVLLRYYGKGKACPRNLAGGCDGAGGIKVSGHGKDAAIRHRHADMWYNIEWYIMRYGNGALS